MGTATHTSHQAGHAAAPAPEVLPNDPERDIDAKKTTLLLVGCLVFVVVTLWVLGIVYDFTMRQAEVEKVDSIPPVELQALRAGEDAALNKRPVGNDSRSVAEINASIRVATDQIIDRYLK